MSHFFKKWIITLAETRPKTAKKPADTSLSDQTSWKFKHQSAEKVMS